MGPGRARLAVQVHIGGGDVRRLENAVAGEEVVHLPADRSDEGPVHRAVDHHMGDMDASGSQFPGQALGDGAQARLGGREGGETLAPPDGRRRAGEDQGPAGPGAP